MVCDNPAQREAVAASVADLPHRLVDVPPGWHLGAKRNAGLESASGDFIVQWDDDDWYHPARIEQQLRTCRESGGEHAVFLRRQIAYAFDLDTAYVREFPANRGVCIHASILHPRSDLRYPQDLTMGEDTAFLCSWLKRGQILLFDNDPFLYVRLSHGRNVCPRAHIMRHFEGRYGDWSGLTISQQHTLRAVLDNYREAIDASR